jgi:UDP-3-O-[3-hydroxymyristoyl] N-acetylglucosamine deacetylase
MLDKYLMTYTLSDQPFDVTKQHTLGKVVKCKGIALHSGVISELVIKPAEVNHGIVFKRVDVGNNDPFVPADWRLVSDTVLSTTISNSSEISVSTIEHLMAAFAGCGIDNVLIEINGPEVPIMDGSSEPFVQMLELSEIVEQEFARHILKILKPINVIGNGGEHITLLPAKHFSVDFEIDFNSNAIREKTLDIALVNGTFNHSISSARTFGFLEDVDKMRAAGLGLGGSLENVVIVDGENILNNGGLRYKDEFVRHKILDCVGDLYLSGGPILGRVTAYKSGHHFNNQLLKKLFLDTDAWEWVTETECPSVRNYELLTASA